MSEPNEEAKIRNENQKVYDAGYAAGFKAGFASCECVVGP